MTVGHRQCARRSRVGKASHGARARSGGYAAAALDDHGIDEQLERYDDLRRLGNQSEYNALLADEADMGDALDQAAAIVAAVEPDLGS